ncbi:hypothetical protein D3C71_705420 [compost metagenome]
MRILLFILLSSHLGAFAQTKAHQEPEDETKSSGLLIGERGLNRFFFDGSIGFGWATYVNKGKKNSYHDYGGLTDFKIGNNFYFGKSLKPMILRLTYLRTGIIVADGIALYAVLPSLGLGKHFNIRNNKKMSLEPMVHFGAVTYLELFSDRFDYYTYYFSAELKLNIARFSIGLEFTSKKVFEATFSPSSNFERNSYFGFSLGRRFGKKLSF